MNTLKLIDYINASKILKCEAEIIKAVAIVEAPNGGFLSNGNPTILFERHKFFLYTKGKYSNYENICNIRPGGYLGGLKEWDRFDIAQKLDRNAAIKSCSWGKFQTMGFHYSLLGFESPQDFVNEVYKGEKEQLNIFVNFIIKTGLQDELQRKDFKNFAKAYNGKEYYKNKYDIKIQNEYEKLKNLSLFK